jgi:prevent-host-death family protein
MNDERTITSDEARTKMRDLLDDVNYGNNRVRISRYGKPAAVLVPVSWYESRNDVTDLGKNLPDGDPSGRFSEPPVSVAQARARVLYQMDHLEGNCRVAVDVGYALQCLEEAIADYREMAIGTIP